ncbi:hypothetical protein NQ318_015300 [Aromia moschata]|uniref:Uncharacterized protein n=1 Tax=Aromia moschata TaxID=1265417 RepID=A0AAV8XD32_9CUCU|nr:hypothetical protein NQ318_015300 [Aromia moschata]
MCDFEEEALLFAILLDEGDNNRQRWKRRNVWVLEIYKKRREEGEFHKLYPELRKIMNCESFDEILNLIENDITKSKLHLEN